MTVARFMRLGTRILLDSYRKSSLKWTMSDSPNLSYLLSLLNPRIYKLFISHAWNYDDEYKGVVRLLELEVSFTWMDLSVPIENPLPLHPILRKSHRNILRQLEAKIQEADCLLVLAAMYFNHSGWIQSEIEIARDYNKPIIAVRPQGQERMPEALNLIGVSELVGWNKSSIISAIRKYATPTGKPSPAPTASIPTAPMPYSSTGLPTLTSQSKFDALSTLLFNTQPAPSPLANLVDAMRRAKK
jgi:hypothetical protein